MILNEIIGDYSHTIKVVYMDEPSEVKVSKGGEVIYDGPAMSIVDESNLLSFIDIDGKSRKIQKYATYSWI